MAEFWNGKLVLRDPLDPSKLVTTTTAGASVGLDVNIIGGTITGSDGAILDGANSAIKANVFDLTNSNPVATAIVDGNGDQITSFGGGTQYAEGDTAATITGTAMMMEGAANALVPAQGTAADGLLVNLGTNNDISGTVTANAGTNLNTSALALEDGGNLADIKAKTDNIPALGQALAAASVPVILPADTITTLTPPAAITNYAQETGGNLATIAGKDFATQTTLSTLLTETVFTGRLGEVQASPTANTVLARLKDLLTGIILAAGTNAIGKLAANDGVDVGDVSINNAPTVKPNALKKISVTSYNVDDAAVQVFDASASATATSVIIANCGDEAIYLYWDNTAGPLIFFKKLAAGESWEFPVGYTSDTTNDIYAERASAQTNDDVITTVLGEV